jgi:L-fuculose-phosphate aldolase
MLITPTRRHPADLEPDDLVHLDFDGHQLTPGAAAASLEWRLHAATYRARPDVGAVVHTHSPHATARSFDPTPMAFETEERVYFDLEPIEVAPPAAAGSERLARGAVRALGPRSAALLARHGVIGVGGDPREALDMCCLVEHQALILDAVDRRAHASHSPQAARRSQPS